jgi:hypothetical protein
MSLITLPKEFPRTPSVPYCKSILLHFLELMLLLRNSGVKAPHFFSSNAALKGRSFTYTGSDSGDISSTRPRCNRNTR